MKFRSVTIHKNASVVCVCVCVFVVVAVVEIPFDFLNLYDTKSGIFL